jgi:hypothetical protein
MISRTPDPTGAPSLAAPLTLALVLAASACGSSGESAPPVTDLVGALELPVSHRFAPAAPAGAAKIEVSPTELRIDGQKVAALVGGRLAAGDVHGGQIPSLRDRLGTRSAAAIHASASASWGTTVAVLDTLKAANVGIVAFAVRQAPPPPQQGRPAPGPSTTVGYLELRDWKVVPESDDELSFDTVLPLPWQEFRTRWQEVASACRTSPTGDCMHPPEKVAEGGNTRIVLRTRGDGVQVQFFQVGAPPPVTESQPQVAMIPGVPSPRATAPAEPATPPATEASFTLRASVLTQPDSPVGAMLRPVCGSRACGVVLVGDADTPSMRPIALLGAAFPDGTAPPAVAFQRTR